MEYFWYNVGNTIINHPQFHRFYRWDLNHSQSTGWLKWHCFAFLFHRIFLWGDHGMQHQLMVWLGYDMITGWCVLLRWLDPKGGAPDSQVGLINLIYVKLLGATGRCLTTLLVRVIILSPQDETPARNHAGCIFGGWDSNQGIMSQLGGYHLLENPPSEQELTHQGSWTVTGMILKLAMDEQWSGRLIFRSFYNIHVFVETQHILAENLGFQVLIFFSLKTWHPGNIKQTLTNQPSPHLYKLDCAMR